MTAEGRLLPQDLLRVAAHHPSGIDSVTVLTVVGEVDLLSVPVLDEAVTARLTAEPELLVIDLTDVSFLASVGMTVLLKAQRDAGPNARVRVVAPERSAVARTLELTGLLDALAVTSTVSAALSR
ncbi:STAS domain-containing protein [Amycolatopsis sp. cmx-4-83]|uniref:STAS domain-containing protein n=1 Tax=Amycolatopsis sp. cmx-4-83 TaxID=2790940 RepID=UPI00397978AF